MEANFFARYEGWNDGWQLYTIKGKKKPQITAEGQYLSPRSDRDGQIFFHSFEVAHKFILESDKIFESALRKARKLAQTKQ